MEVPCMTPVSQNQAEATLLFSIPLPMTLVHTCASLLKDLHILPAHSRGRRRRTCSLTMDRQHLPLGVHYYWLLLLPQIYTFCRHSSC